MRWFDWLFGKPADSGQPGKKRYEYPTGNLETAIRVQRGEQFMKVREDVRPRWQPGNEYLWDEYDPESLLDTPEKAQYLVNQLLFCRLSVYRALRAAGNDVRGQDPFNFTDQVPAVLEELEARLPDFRRFRREGFQGVQVRVTRLELSPDDPGIPPESPPDQSTSD